MMYGSIVLELMKLDSPENLITTLHRSSGCDYHTVRKVIEKLRYSSRIFCIPNTKLLGSSLVVAISRESGRRKLPYGQDLIGKYIFIKGWSIVPRPRLVLVLVVPYSETHIVVKELEKNGFIVLVESGAGSVPPSEYFLNMNRRRILLEYCRNPLLSLREHAKRLGVPFSTFRYIVERGFSEGIVDFRKKMFSTPILMGVVQTIVRGDSPYPGDFVCFSLSRFRGSGYIADLMVMFALEGVRDLLKVREHSLVNYSVFPENLFNILLSHRF